MPDHAAISLIAKILARAGSDNSNEAAAALDSAYKRMVRDGVTLRDLLSLPEKELYQNTLVKLVDVILDNQPNLSLPTRRKAYAEYMLLIAARFSGDSDGKSDRPSGKDSSSRSKGQGSSREEEARQYEERRAREESARGRSDSSSSNAEKPYKQENSKTPEHKAAYPFSIGKFSFSFSSASFFSALQAIFGRGSLVWHSLHDPGRALRLFAACFLFGAAFAGVALTVAAIVHTITHSGPVWDIQLKNASSFLVAIGFIWKARAFHRDGWFR